MAKETNTTPVGGILNIPNMAAIFVIFFLMNTFRENPPIYFTLGFFNAIRWGQVLRGESRYIICVEDFKMIMAIVAFGYFIYYPLNYVFGLL